KALLAMMQAYRKQYKLRFAYLIPSSLYGPGDACKGILSSVIPSLMDRFLDAQELGEKEVVCWGSGKAIRSFLFAADAAKAIALACVNLDQDEIVNLPGSGEVTIGEVAAAIGKIVGYSGKIIWEKTKPEGRPSIILDGTRAKDLLDWEPTTKLEDGLKMTLTWFCQTRGK